MNATTGYRRERQWPKYLRGALILLAMIGLAPWIVKLVFWYWTKVW